MTGSESPIATAILGAALVEHELESELRLRFRRKDDSTWKDLSADSGPLGTFNQKIIAAYGFGILDGITKDGMNTVRNIRNAFAHSRQLIEFDHKLIVSELRKITLPMNKRAKMYEDLSLAQSLEKGPRTSYIVLCFTLSLYLLDKRHKLEAKASQARRDRRRRELAAALQQIPTTGGLGLLGRLGGYPPVDPSQTVLGSYGLLAPDPIPAPSRKKDK